MICHALSSKQHTTDCIFSLVPRQEAVNTTTTVLIFDNPTAADRGKYRCHANDESASITDDITVRVVRKPMITVRPDALYTSLEGSSVLLPCASNDPDLPVSINT